MKYLLTLSILLASFAVRSQTNVYHAFPDSNFAWIEQFYTPEGNGCICSGDCHARDTYQYFLSGDTVIGSYIYSKIYKTGGRESFLYSMPVCPPNVIYSPVWYYYSNIYSGAIRQDTLTKEVFYRNNNSDELLYDFDLQLGDTLTQYAFPNSDNYVSQIDSILINGQYRKRFWLTTTWNQATQPHVALIEGIGSTYGLLSPISEPFEHSWVLKCASDNGTTVYQDSFYTCDVPNAIIEAEMLSFDLSPNPSNGIFNLTMAEKPASIEVINVTGQRVLSLRGGDVTTAIDLTGKRKGIYLVKIEGPKGLAVKKIVID